MTDFVKAVPRLEVNGAQIPAIGLGTFRLTGDDCVRAVASALEIGYRHLDTAVMYGNEAEVGEGLRTSGLKRDEVFVTTKVLPTEIGAGALQRSAQGSLERLKLDQVDLLLIHWPNAAIPLAESIEALCDAKRRGYARNIGVANFPVAMLEEAVRLAATHGEKLAADQCEHHPRLSQEKLLSACRTHGLAFVSYTPIGKGSLTEDPVIVGLARKHGRKPTQIIMRWHMQQPGNAAIPKSGSPEHQRENIDVFDFELSDEDMRAINGLARPDGRMINPAFAPQWDA